MGGRVFVVPAGIVHVLGAIFGLVEDVIDVLFKEEKRIKKNSVRVVTS